MHLWALTIQGCSCVAALVAGEGSVSVLSCGGVSPVTALLAARLPALAAKWPQRRFVAIESKLQPMVLAPLTLRPKGPRSDPQWSA